MPQSSSRRYERVGRHFEFGELGGLRDVAAMHHQPER